MRRLAPLTLCCLLLVCGRAFATDHPVTAQANFTWSSTPLTIPAGDSVTWSNPITNVQHNVCVASVGQTAGTNCNEFHEPLTPTLGPWTTSSHVFNTVGTFNYECQLHTSMKGTITVTDPDTASVAGTVWHDANGNGVQDNAETGLSGVTVHLSLPNDSTPIADTTTAIDGTYSFGSLAAGDYVVTYVVPANYGNTGPSQLPVTLAIRQHATGEDFFTALAMASVQGTVNDQTATGIQGVVAFADTNNNGQLDQGEPSAPPTDANGAFTLANLTPGSYHLSYVVPSGYVNTGPRPIDFTLAGENDVATGKDFTATQAASVAGTVWNDADGSGTVTVGDAGISGRTVFLSITGDSTPIADTTTNGAGAYSFSGLLPGDYQVSYSRPPNRDDTTPAATLGSFHLDAGQSVTNKDFFAAPGTASITGVLHDDPNGNGVVDAGEGGIGGATIGLDTSGDGVADVNTTTASNGSYSFAGLIARSYRVLLTVPAGYERTGGNAAFDVTLPRGGSATSPGTDFFARVPPPPPSGTQSTTTLESTGTQGPGDIDVLGSGQGTSGDDLLNGTGGADKIFGLGGNDLLLGLGGNDLLDGGPGNDSLDGGAGKDRLFGRAGNDNLTGGPGDDTLFGGAGNDKLMGGAGNDVLDGGAGKDSYFGGPGNDTINARDGVAESIDCGAGKDKVTADKRDRVRGCEKVTRR